jgi:UDP-N-acetylglucosamine 2-epimerase (non-hydrolysing)
MKKVLCIVGARPNFMKIAPILRALREPALGIHAVLVHTGQHYDYAMNESFFTQLHIPAPDISLEVGSGSHAVQTAEIMKRFEPVLDAECPDCVLVVGDVNSTIACALVAAKKAVRVVHVEAGLRSRDRSMPEEINRILTDQLSDRLYVTEREAISNLRGEGIAEQRIVFAGNVMIDTLMHCLPSAVPAAETIALACKNSKQNAATLPEIFTRADRGFCLLTLHRPANVDDAVVLRSILDTLAACAVEIPIIFPVHPRTQEKIRAAGLSQFFDQPHLLALPPLGYLEMLGLIKNSRAVLTDSGGLQEETTALGVPCITLRDNTERPITVSEGTNQIAGSDPIAIRQALSAALTFSSADRPSKRPELWDGHAADRIARDLSAYLTAQTSLIQ